MVSLNRCHGSFDTLADPSSGICVMNKTKDVNLNVFNMITKINDAKALTKHILCVCKYKLDGRICNSNQKWNNIRCQ